VEDRLTPETTFTDRRLTHQLARPTPNLDYLVQDTLTLSDGSAELFCTKVVLIIVQVTTSFGEHVLVRE